MKSGVAGKSFLIALFITINQFAHCQPQSEPKHTFSYLETNFNAPGNEFGSAPLWVWNTKVTTEIIDDMMQGFKENSFGGVFIHPRPGLITEYLSDEWFELCRYTLEKGRKLGLDVWIYDENSYPSGFAGGHVPARMPSSYNQGQILHLTKADELPTNDKKYFIYQKKEGDRFININDQLDEEKGKTGDYYLFAKIMPGNSPWYGGFSYVDLLVEGVTEKFIEVTMDGYEKVFGDEFGKAVPGVFTDEPNIAIRGKGNIRWTPDLFRVFHDQWGYDLSDHLPSLFEETGDWKRVRHNYYNTLLQMFIDRWSKPWLEYTERKGLEWTGHYWEHGWPNPNHGGDNMAMYAWHQRPGIDLLFNQFNEKSPNAHFGNIRAVKELSSVANQLNKKRTLSETYGGGGWELTFKDMKRLGDWQYVLGVNTLNQHLSFMTIMGTRKYDYPQSFSYHSPWWPYYKPINKYFARLSLALSRGQQVNDILVLEPTTSTWMYAGFSQSNPRMQEIGREFQAFVTELEKAQVEYDLGSENIIKDHGRVKGADFIIGSRSYSTVVIPPGTENIDETTFQLLQQYKRNGGKVIQFEDVERIDGADDLRLKNFSVKGSVHSFEKLNKSILDEYFSSEGINFPDLENVGGNLLHHRRQLADGGQLLFLVNASMEEGAQGKVSIKGRDALRLDTQSGEIMDYPEQDLGDDVVLNYNLTAAGSLLLFISNEQNTNYPQYVEKQPVETVKADESQVERIGPNVLTIDFCDVELEDVIVEDMHVFDASDLAFKKHGFKRGNPWFRAVQYKKTLVKRDTFSLGSGFKATYNFNVKSGVDMTSLRAVVERPALWKVLINGKHLPPLKDKWWLDKSFAVFDISKEAVQGLNKLELIADPMSIHAEIEPVYILGDFNLQPSDQGWTIVESKPISIGSWKEQGAPLYGHEVSYTKTITLNKKQRPENYWVELGDWKGTVAVVNVNGEQAGVLSYPPYIQDISPYLKKGKNKIEVVIVGSLKNTLGPFHNNPKPGLVSPWKFRNVKEYPSGTAYQLYDYGLLEDFKVKRFVENEDKQAFN